MVPSIKGGKNHRVLTSQNHRVSVDIVLHCTIRLAKTGKEIVSLLTANA